MAAFSKLYLTNRAAPYVPSTLRGAWDDSAGAVTKALDPQKDGGGPLTSVARAETNASATWDVLLYRGVSGPLAAQTINCDLNVLIGALESSATADLCWHIHVYATQGDSDTPRVTLLTDYVETTVNEWGTTATTCGKALAAAQAVTQTISAGDRLVVEIGYIARNSVTTSFTGTLYYGTQNATDGSIVGDLTAGANPTLLAGFVSFSVPVTEMALTARVSQLVTRTVSAGTPEARVSQLSVRTLSAHGEATGYVSQLVVRTLSPNGPSVPQPDARITQVVGEVFGSDGVPDARVTQVVAEVFGAGDHEARVTQVVAEVFGDRPVDLCNATPVYEAPCAIQTPEFWTAIVDENGDVSLAAMHALRDPATYYGGYKAPRLLTIDRVSRVASDWLTRTWQAQTATVTYADTDRVLRGLTRGDVTSAQLYVYLTSAANRHVYGYQRLLFQGPIYDDPLTEHLTTQATANDIISVDYSLFSDEKLIPQRIVDTTDFPNRPTASDGFGVPIIGGDVISLITDQLGALKLYDVGDVTLNGVTKRGFMVCGHAVHGLDVYQNGLLIPDGDANCWQPYFANWTDLVPSGAKMATINSHDYTLVLLDGTRATDAISGEQPLYVNINGFGTKSDASGSQITDGVILAKYVLINWLIQSWQTGAWLPSPTFDSYPANGDAICRVDVGSFDVASAVAQTYLAGGFLGGFVIGAGGQRQSVRQVWADLLQSFNLMGCQSQYQQLKVVMLDRRADTFLADVEPVTDRRDILAQPRFTIRKMREWLCNDFGYQWAANYRADGLGAWNGSDSQGHAPSKIKYGVITKRITYPMVRDDDTADAVAGQQLEFRAQLRSVATYAQSLCGLKRDVLDGVPVTHYGGRGAGGWTETACWVLAQRVTPKNATVTVDVVDVQDLMS
jgi:hypothetical protein